MERRRNTINEKSYVLWTLGLALLLVSGFLGPTMIFGIQDRQLGERIQTGEQSTLDMSVMKGDYEPELRNRLAAFAKGIAEGNQYYYTITDHTADEEVAEALESALFSRQVALFMSDVGTITGLGDRYYSYGAIIEDCKRCIIYDREFDSGMTLMAWYMDVTLGDGTKIQLVADTEDHTLYYMKVTENAYDYGMYRVEELLAREDELIELFVTYDMFFNGYYKTDLSILQEIESASEKAVTNEMAEGIIYEDVTQGTASDTAMKMYEKTVSETYTRVTAALGFTGIEGEPLAVGYNQALPYEAYDLRYHVTGMIEEKTGLYTFEFGIVPVEELLVERIL